MKRLLLFFLILCSISTFAQKHQWTKSFENIEESFHVNRNANTLSIDSLDNTYVAGFCGDSMLVDTFLLGKAGENYIAKIDFTGKTEWVRTFNANKKCRVFSVLAVNSNRILVYAGVLFDTLGLTVQFSQNHSLTFSGINPVKSNSNYATFVVEYDSAGNVIATQKIYQESGWSGGLVSNINIVKDSKSNLIFSVARWQGTAQMYTKTNNQGVSGNTTNSSGNPQIRIIKYNTYFDTILWITNPVDNILNNYLPWGFFSSTSIAIDTMDNVYWSITVQGALLSFKGVTYNIGTGSGWRKGILFILNANGQVLYTDFFNEFISYPFPRDEIVDIVAIDTNQYYLIGYFMDTLRIMGQKYYPPQVLLPDSIIEASLDHNVNMVVVKMGTKAVHWVKIAEKRVNRNSYSSHNPPVATIRKDGFGHTYACFYYSHNYDISIGGLTDSIKKPFDPASSFAFVKFDSLGNALWIKEGVGVYDMQPNNVGELVYCGNYGGTVEFDPYTLSANYLSGFVAKLMDYSITRGPVSAGPYCAGDSIYVPFTLTGEFDTANWFIAQLSDEHGNFESGFRELGRIKGNTDSIVVGVLPLFQVASSAKYRIRIRATKPAVQSFYWEDTLQLLIYSRDKADPGPQEFLCLGDSMEIQTFGGTKWEWSPNQFITDTTARKTLVFPPQTTTYRIVISDSSGCGEADTAFKTIVVRQKPQIASPQTDFIVCFNDTLQIPASFSLGDSSNFISNWYLITGQGWQLRKTSEGLLQDTFAYIVPSNMPSLQRIALVHTDQCYPKTDTLQFNLIRALANPSPAILSTKDSLFCSNSSSQLFAQLPNQPKLQWHWLNAQGDTLQSGSNSLTDSLEVTPIFVNNQPETYRVVTINNCVGRRDTASITLFPKEPLEVFASQNGVILSEVEVCSGQEITLSASATGGVPENYQYQWFATPDPSSGGEWILLSTEDTLNFKPSTENNSQLSTQHLKLILSDDCMPRNDTVEILLKVKPKLQAEIVNKNGDLAGDTTICYGSELQFNAKGFGGDSTNYSFEWYWNDSLISNDLNLNFTPIHPSPSTFHQLSLILNDGCSLSDTSSITINVLPPLKSNFVAPDTVCSGEEIELVANGSGGLESTYSYQWFATPDPSSGGEWILLGNENSLSFTPIHPSPSTIHLIISDGCTSPNDTFTHEIYVRPALEVTIKGFENNSTLCFSDETLFEAIPTGGLPQGYEYQWILNGHVVSSSKKLTLNQALIQSLPPSPPLNFPLPLKLILSDGCSEPNAEAQIQIDRLPSTLSLSANPTEGCEPLEVEFQLNTDYPNTYSYKLLFTLSDSSQSPPPNNPPLSFTYTQGIYTPSLTFTTQYGCSLTSSGPEITVFPKPIADFTFVPENPSLDKPKVNFSNLSTGAISYLWNLDPFGDFTDFEPEVIYQDSGRFRIRLIAFSDKGCSDTLEGFLFVKDIERMFLPNAFSPNRDGLNDVFEPKVKGFAIAEFNIYTRWGERIFSSQGTGWDGTYRGSLAPMGVYTYTLRLVDEKGEKLLFTGMVTLVR